MAEVLPFFCWAFSSFLLLLARSFVCCCGRMILTAALFDVLTYRRSIALFVRRFWLLLAPSTFLRIDSIWEATQIAESSNRSDFSRVERVNRES
jgi:hypothetical protein